MTTDRRRAAAERQRKCRERKRAGRRVLAVPVDFCTVSEMLIEGGFLDWQEAENPVAVADALASMIESSSLI